MGKPRANSTANTLQPGVVLYECATGHRPFAGKTSAAILAAIISRSPVAAVTFNSEMPLRLQEVINNCLEKDRELRYPIFVTKTACEGFFDRSSP